MLTTSEIAGSQHQLQLGLHGR